MADENYTWLLYGAGAIAVIMIAKSLTGPSATTALNNQPISNNPFSPQFGVDNSAGGSSNLTQLVAMYDAQATAGTINDTAGLFCSAGTIVTDGDALYQSYGIITTDDNTIIATAYDLISQYSVSLLNRYITGRYGKELFSLLKNGNSPLDFDFLLPASATLNTFVTHIQTLPVFPNTFPS
jgi:hypothetical protein